MKVKNLVIGLRVQVKSTGHKGFWESNAGKSGRIVDIDIGAYLDVKVQYDDTGAYEWGNHKGIKRAPVEATETFEPKIAVDSRVRLKSNGILGFLAGDVGTVKKIDIDGMVAIHFDTARSGWEAPAMGIPDLHGLWVYPYELEVITE